MDGINTDEIVKELDEAIKYKDVNKVIKLNHIIRMNGISEIVERQLGDASYGLYRFIVSQAKEYNIGSEENTEKEENTARKENKSKEDEIKEERQ